MSTIDQAPGDVPEAERQAEAPFASNSPSCGVPLCAQGPPQCFDTCMIHLYRGEMQRMTVWRRRLDTTTHWAIILSIGLTTFALGSSQIPHFIMLLGLAFNTLFMVLEGRRYQHLHHSKWRIALLEHNYFARLLGANRPVETHWQAQLESDLQHPHFTMRHSQGVRLRLRRNYLVLFYFITAVWLTKVFIHPSGPATIREFYSRLAVGDLFPSWFVVVTASLFLVLLTTLALITPTEEALDHWSKLEHARFLSRVNDKTSDGPA